MGGRGRKGREHGGSTDGWTSGWGRTEENEARFRVTCRQADVGRRRMGGQGDGLKGARTSLFISLSRTRTTCLTIEQVCRVLGSLVGSRWNPMLKHPYNPKGNQTHLPRLSASVRGARKGTLNIPSVPRIRTKCVDIFREG